MKGGESVLNYFYFAVYQIRTPEGEELAIIVMDVQSLFDLKSSIGDAASIFACSLLSASVHIYNLTQNFRVDELSFLHLFIEFAKSVATMAEIGVSDRPPSRDLVFLVNDWRDTKTFSFGTQGGNKLLEK